MNEEKDILKEIESISPLLAQLQGKNVFTIPDGYFETVSDNVLDAVFTEKLRAGERNKGRGFSVPEGYFENLSSQILQKIENKTAGDASEETPRTVSRIGNSNIFTVPEGYFENFSSVILSKIKEKPAARVIPLYKRPVFRYAIAAAVAASLFIGIFNRVSDNHNAQNSFAIVNENTVPFKDALKYNSEKAFEKGIASLTDDQIIAYLEKSGTSLDNPMVIENINTSGMPDPLEYLEDDHVLEDYLNKQIN